MVIAVVGSGPSGWATASRLADLGKDVLVVSTNLRNISEAKEETLETFTSTDLNKKLYFGSDYPYRGFPSGPRSFQDGTNLSSSFAQQGLSLVWGATMLPYSQSDIEDWPIRISDLDAGYSYIAEKLPISGRIDQLSQVYNSYFSRQPILLSHRTRRIMESYELSPPPSMVLGASRLAVETGNSEHSGCVYCARCLTGCPFGKIWRSDPITSSHVRYQFGFRVLRIERVGSELILCTIDEDGNVSNLGPFDKIFLAAGPVESFRILSTSKMVKSEAQMLDSATFFLPFVSKIRFSPKEQSRNTLSQVFIRLLQDRSPSSHLQLYDYSDDLIRRAKGVLPGGGSIPDWFLSSVLHQLLVGIGYLDSKVSPRIDMRLGEDGNVFLSCNSLEERTAVHEIDKILKGSVRAFRSLGLYPLKFLLKLAQPGTGVHSGGWLPMGSQTDLLGQPDGLKGVHVVDSSVLPSIPAGAITFTIMANAVRIVDAIAS